MIFDISELEPCRHVFGIGTQVAAVAFQGLRGQSSDRCNPGVEQPTLPLWQSVAIPERLLSRLPSLVALLATRVCRMAKLEPAQGKGAVGRDRARECYCRRRPPPTAVVALAFEIRPECGGGLGGHSSHPCEPRSRSAKLGHKQGPRELVNRLKWVRLLTGNLGRG